ncbi:MAG: peptidase M15A [Proteobacteria bacterium]|nr:peptidase M15A [Pseudomonadota bacterium]
MRLSPHFTLAELTKSQTAIRRGIRNAPNAGQINNLKRLAKEILEPLREHFGRPFSPSSGFRSQALNVAIGSKSTSQHTRGEAVDFELPGIPNRDVAEWIRDHLDFDQLILEFHDPEDPMSGWVHVSLKEKENRNQVLTINHNSIWAGLGEAI